MRQLLSFVTVLLLAACSTTPEPQPQASLSEVEEALVVPAGAPTIVAFGDSLTAGYGLAPQESYPSRLQKILLERGLSYLVINEGVSGDTTATALTRADTAAAYGAQLAIIAIGANDGLRGLPADEMERNIREIIQRFQAAGSQVALIGMRIPPNMGPEYVAQFESVFPRVAGELNLPFLPFLLEGVAGDARLNQDDGVHPTAEGTRIVAAQVADFIEPLLQDKATAKP